MQNSKCDGVQMEIFNFDKDGTFTWKTGLDYFYLILEDEDI
jgi:hypothetical protein